MNEAANVGGGTELSLYLRQCDTAADGGSRFGPPAVQSWLFCRKNGNLFSDNVLRR
jgi:hypothetical protein